MLLKFRFGSPKSSDAFYAEPPHVGANLLTAYKTCFMSQLGESLEGTRQWLWHSHLSNYCSNWGKSTINERTQFSVPTGRRKSAASSQ